MTDNIVPKVYAFSRIAFIFSIALLISSVIIIGIKGLNKGVDFTGGTMIDFSLNNDSSFEAAEKKIAALLNSQNFTFHNNEDKYIVKLRSDSGTNDENLANDSQVKHIDILKNKINEAFKGGVVFNQVTSIGPQISGSLVNQSILALSLSMLSIFIYMTLRFNFYFAASGCIILMHDILITVGMISLTGIEVNLTSIAAILTIMGYCINDTVVIYDRIRSNISYNKKNSPLIVIISTSVLETLKRSIITSLVTFLAVIGILFFSSTSIKNFAIIVGFGIIIGTYGSIMVSSFMPLRLGYKAPLAK